MKFSTLTLTTLCCLATLCLALEPEKEMSEEKRSLAGILGGLAGAGLANVAGAGLLCQVAAGIAGVTAAEVLEDLITNPIGALIDGVKGKDGKGGKDHKGGKDGKDGKKGGKKGGKHGY